MKNYYENWTAKEIEQGYKCSVSMHEEIDYWSSKELREYTETTLRYQPRGYWSNVITIRIGDGKIDFSRSTGGDVDISKYSDIEDNGGLDKIQIYIKCLQDAEKYIKEAETFRLKKII
jgi:hypothetical protein